MKNTFFFAVLVGIFLLSGGSYADTGKTHTLLMVSASGKVGHYRAPKKELETIECEIKDNDDKLADGPGVKIVYTFIEIATDQK